MILSGWIYGAVKGAIHDAMPSAIQDALGWHSHVHVEEKVVTRKIRDGFEAIPMNLEAKIMTENDMPQLAETKIVPKYKEVSKIVRKTYCDRSRFNPVTGEYDYKKDECPIIEIVSNPPALQR